ncbi:vitamin B12-dependent ribonucleotide reductase [Enterococcus dongliensis]|uniref:vitamin B12-dependent ribonucleotide reductase n=1 Tax=Enterococcus dongliensis TaxID=2559925 RepID=UPI00288E345A|nr:vitamin B12-dependent ribonucleotide reductase [Enterococcus dongliensis]MDT2674976.1 vitamin B12-dependent ribonucleotide reductase [Enterococcus dongliensis]
MNYPMDYIEKLNQDISCFDKVTKITSEMSQTFEGIARLIMLDRYAYKDLTGKTITVGDFVILTTHTDPQYPTRGIGIVEEIVKNQLIIHVEEEFQSSLTDPEEIASGRVNRSLNEVEKPLELFFEQIAIRVAKGISDIDGEKKSEFFADFYHHLTEQNLIPAGRVLYGAGTDTEVTYFNCYVMPFIHDSRAGLAKHRQEVMEIMSRGGGVGTNGSTLRPKAAIVHGVNGKSSGAISWLNDLANLTNLVEQGGSRRGAQMIMLNDWHPDIFEFILSKIQNPVILQRLITTSKNATIRQLAAERLNFSPLAPNEKAWLEFFVQHQENNSTNPFVKDARQKLQIGGTYSVKDPDFLTGANISVCLTKEFMQAVEKNQTYELRFPAIDDYDSSEMADYDQHWTEIGDVREWEATGRKVKVHQTIKARDLWDLITYCATYSAEPGIFFIDNANEMTNAQSYGQKVVATNPCGEQPLTPYAVCNLAAINLANMVNKETKTVDFDKLADVVKTSVRFQDNVIDATPYFFKKNEKQAKGERRIGLGVMGLADLLIYCEKIYGSQEGNQLVDQIFEKIAITAYETSVALAKEKGSFPFLIDQNVEETKALRQRFIETGYMRKMPASLRQDILTYGIRNSHLLTVAPTGSTGTMTGVSTGLEPYFSFSYFRSGRLGKFIEVQAEIVEEYLSNHPEVDNENLPPFFISAMELTPEAHVSVQCTIQRWIDSSISKTVNAPKGYQVNQVAAIYEDLYRGGAKGGTVYVDGSRNSQVLTLEADENSFAEYDVSNDTETADDEIEERCPICHEGKIEEIGGCSTCTHCKVQLRCGL